MKIYRFASQLISILLILFTVSVSASCLKEDTYTSIDNTPAYDGLDETGNNTVSVPKEKLNTVEKDIEYAVTGGEELMLDIYYPDEAKGAAPAIVYVHGGAWMKGSKDIAANNMNVTELLRRGYVVFSIDYRLAPEFPYPAQIEDVKCAVRYIRAHAEEYGIDINRLGALGGSAGGHLVSLLGTSDNDFYNSTGGYNDQSARVQAVVDCYGPADLTAFMGSNNNGVLIQVYGTNNSNSPVLKEASPVTYVSEDDPPFLILHGNRDVVVPVTQSGLMDDALDEHGVPSELVIVKNAGHGFSPADSPIVPSRQEISNIIANFFDKYLKN